MENKAIQLQQAIDGIITDIIEMAEYLSKQQPVSYKSKAFIQFQGGILGWIRESREEKRMMQLINEPLYNDLSFYKVYLYIIEQTKILVQHQLELQSMSNPEESVYYGNIKNIIEVINLSINSWYNYSPHLATKGFDLDGEKGSLMLFIQESTQSEFIKLDLPSEYEYLKTKTKDASSNGGCLGILVGLITISGGLVSLVIFLLLC